MSLYIYLKVKILDCHPLISAEIGDYDETLDREHLKANRYLPHQERCLEKILELHPKHV